MSDFKHDGAASREPTRTMAVFGRTACSDHRLAIQSRITASGFTILSERVEQWSSTADVDFLHDFLYTEEEGSRADDAYRARWIARLTDAPIYVMALQRHRAAEMWQDLCGPDAEDGAECGAGLRADFDAAIFASPPSVAERQIAICFPTLATSEALASLQLTPRKDGPNIVTAVDRSGAYVVREGDDIAFDEHGQAFDTHSGEPLAVVHNAGGGSSPNPAPRSNFKARPMPSSTKVVNQPRLSRAAALRMGVALPEAPRRRAATLSSSCQDDGSIGTADNSNLGISGLPKANVSVPKSLAAPSIVPRMNRVATARTTGPNVSSSSDVSASQPRERKPVDYSNTPGHKRSSTVCGGGAAGSSSSGGGGSALASLAAPSMAPRLNKAAAARAAAANGVSGSGGSGGGGHSFARRPSSVAGDARGVRKPVDFSNTPGHKRTSVAGDKTTATTSTLKSLQAPTIAPRANRTSLARVGVDVVAKPAVAASRAAPPAARASGKENGPAGVRERVPVDYSHTPGHKRAAHSVSTIASLAQPSIAPRLNATAQKRLSMPNAAASSVVRTTVRGAAPPSSFRV